MPRGYFSSFPVVSYANTRVRDVTRRAAVNVSRLADPRSRLPLELRPGTRADTIADRYYNDSSASWLVYLAAGTIDPHWGWYLDDDAVNELAAARFGSVEEAKQRVRRYVTNWETDVDTLVSQSDWSALLDEQREYWEPVFGAAATVLGYQRRREDWAVTTNMIVDVVADASGVGAFVVDERAQFFSSNVAIGNCQVAFSNSTHVVVQHIAGNTSTIGSTLTGLSSSATCVVSSSNTVLQNISAGVASYWEPEYQFDYVAYENEKKRALRLVDARYVDEARRELLQLLAE